MDLTNALRDRDEGHRGRGREGAEIKTTQNGG